MYVYVSPSSPQRDSQIITMCYFIWDAVVSKVVAFVSDGMVRLLQGSL